MSKSFQGESFTSEISFDLNLILSYGCRLALGAGCYFFGATFREYGYHEELHELMNHPKAAELHRFRLANSSGQGFFWAHHWPHSLQSLSPIWNALSKQSKGHLVFTEHSTKELVLGISLFKGFFQWYFNITSNSLAFPIGGDYELGAVVDMYWNPAEFQRTNLRNHLIEFGLEHFPIQ